ncbi:MAG: hypothetical protein LQ351_004387 [Letrouitia transgressa]|nr:MAG: hypothetical protein LQ351_004387 [Letrouitia transgressa]
MTDHISPGFPTIKIEQGEKASGEEQHVKAELNSSFGSPASQSDEDIYEDAGDLDFSKATQCLYLVRLPKYLWEIWSNYDDDQEIQLGTVRLEGGFQETRRMSLLLSHHATNTKLVPTEYNLQITNRTSANTYAFTEKDLLKYTRRAPGSAEDPRKRNSISQHATSRPTFQDRSGQRSLQGEKGRKWHPYKKNVPKQTGLVGQVKTEMTCLPIENSQYRQIMDERTKRAMFKPRRETKVVGRIEGHVHAPTTVRASRGFEAGFTKKSKQLTTKGQHLKAARMAKNELIDLIFECFKRYNYWPIRSLKKELNQPENWLREVLEPIAHLVRNGPFANCWQLNTTSNEGSYQLVKDEAAPDVDPLEEMESEDDAGTEGEDEENVKMEDVLLSTDRTR